MTVVRSERLGNETTARRALAGSAHPLPRPSSCRPRQGVARVETRLPVANRPCFQTRTPRLKIIAIGLALALHLPVSVISADRWLCRIAVRGVATPGMPGKGLKVVITNDADRGSARLQEPSRSTAPSRRPPVVAPARPQGPGGTSSRPHPV